jgi:branched-chain amino acid transport system ATP-binding protein
MLPLGYEQQTPVITQTWMGQAACLLLDEVLAGLITITSAPLQARLSALKTTGVTIVITEQPLPFITSLADHISVLVNRATQYIGSMTERLTNTVST